MTALVVRSRTMTPTEVDAFVRGNVWQTAKTMPDIPHQYLPRAKCPDQQAFNKFLTTIRRTGYRSRFGKSIFYYLDHEIDGVVWQYWGMGVPLRMEYVINRAVKPDPAPP